MNGWLSPNGKFYECDISAHLETAKFLFFAKNSELALERLRWLKITPDHIFASVGNDFLEDYLDEVSQPQIDWLWEVLNGQHAQEASFALKDYIRATFFSSNKD